MDDVTFAVTKASVGEENTNIVFTYERSENGAKEKITIKDCDIEVLFNGEKIKTINKLDFVLNEYGDFVGDNATQYQCKISIGKKVSPGDTVKVVFKSKTGDVSGEGANSAQIDKLTVSLIDNDENAGENGWYNELVESENEYKPLFPNGNVGGDNGEGQGNGDGQDNGGNQSGGSGGNGGGSQGGQQGNSGGQEQGNGDNQGGGNGGGQGGSGDQSGGDGQGNGGGQDGDGGNSGLTPTTDPDVKEGWTAIGVGDIEKYNGNDGTASYTVTKNNNGSITISHDAAMALYASCSFKTNFGDNNTLYTKITNNSDVAATVQVQVNKAGTEENKYQPTPTVTAVYVDGKKQSDAGEYSMKVSIQAKGSIVIANKFDASKKPDTVAISLNSQEEIAGTVAKGNITVSGISMKNVTDESELGTAETPSAPGEKAEITFAAFDGWGKYDIAEGKGETVTMSHSKKVEKYGCCGMDIKFGKNNTVEFKVKNNGSETAYVKISVKNEAWSNENDSKSGILTATVNGTQLDYAGHGALAEIKPGETASFVLTLDTTLPEADKFVVSLNSEATEDGEAEMPSTGNITISEAYMWKSE